MNIYILGAGISIGVGIAPLYQVVESALAEFKLSIDFNYNKNSLTKKEYSIRLNQFYKPIETKLKNKKVKEDIIDFDLMWQEFKSKEKKIFKSIYYWYFWDKSNNVSISNALRQFVKKLDPQHDIIITFNYDLMLEKVIEELYRENDIDFYYSYNKSNYREPKTNRTIKTIRILRPLGSINWLHCNMKKKICYKFKYNGIERKRFFLPDDEFIKISTRYGLKKESIYQIDHYYEVFDKKSKSITPLYDPTVVGTSEKWSVNIWNEIFSLLNKNCKATIIGYSFIAKGKEKDCGFYLMKKNVKKEFEKFHKTLFGLLKLNKCAIVNPDKRLLNYLKASKGSKVLDENSLIEKTFEQWLL
jgi:hypothetical protein